MNNFETFFENYESTQLDEGFKNLLLALFSLGAGMYEANYVYNLLNQNVPNSPTQQIQIIDQLKNKIHDPKFDNTAQEVIGKIQSKIKTQTPKSEDNVLNTATKLILPSEIYGGDINNKANDVFMSPYLDDVGLWTVGIGHLLGSTENKNAWVQERLNKGKSQKLSRKEAMDLFNQDLRKHQRLAQIKFKKEWNRFPEKLKAVLIDISFRGDLEKKGPGDFSFVNLIKRGKLKQAGNEYLDHTEYKKRISKRDSDGVVKRMNRNAAIISGSI